MTASAIEPLPAAESATIEPERRASWLELFFDLCFVVAVGAVAQTLHGNPSLGGITIFVVLFIPVWWAWLQYAWYATSFPEAGLANRLGAFAAMLAILAMAARVGSASDGDPSGFIYGFAIFHVIVALLFLRAARLYPERHDFAVRYATGFGLAAAVWVGSFAAPEAIRPWIWTTALLIDLITPAVAVRSIQGMTYDVRHIPERYGLFTLIVLGEAIIAVARGTSEAEWNPAAVIAALAGFVMAVVIWTAYFAHPHAELLERGRLASFFWGYGHIFVWASIAITGVGIELAIEAAAAGHGFPLAERLILCGGGSLYLASMALLRSAGAGHFTDRVVLTRLGAAFAFLAVGLVGGPLAPEMLAVIVAAIAVAAGIAISHAWRTVPSDTA